MKVNKAFMQEINTWHKIILSFRVKASIMSEGKSECNSMCADPCRGLQLKPLIAVLTDQAHKPKLTCCHLSYSLKNHRRFFLTFPDFCSIPLFLSCIFLNCLQNSHSHYLTNLNISFTICVGL